MPASSRLTTALAAAAAALLLAACAAETSGPTAAGAAVETGTALPPPVDGETRVESDLSKTAVAPVEAPGGDGDPAPQASSEAVVIQGPDGTTWMVNSPRDEEAYRADVDDCYRYAVGLTRRDAQVLDDRNAGIDTLSNDSRYAPLRQRVDEFDLRNRRSSLMSSCMESKGYARADTVLPRLEF